MKNARSATRPPDFVLLCVEPKPKPTLINGLLCNNLLRIEIDQSQIVFVETAAIDQRGLAIGESLDVKNQVRGLDMLSSRGQMPAVRQ